jgi:hypothetical protein
VIRSKKRNAEAGDGDKLHVWLVSDADDYRAMHDYILFEQGNDGTLYECEGQAPVKPVGALLAAAGFGPGTDEAPVRVQTMPAASIRFVKMRGFEVEADKRASLDFAVRVVLRGGLGGFTSVLAGQVGFHRAIFAFEYLWAVAGRPSILVKHPAMERSIGGGRVPGAIDQAAFMNPSLLATITRLR